MDPDDIKVRSNRCKVTSHTRGRYIKGGGVGIGVPHLYAPKISCNHHLFITSRNFDAIVVVVVVVVFNVSYNSLQRKNKQSI